MNKEELQFLLKKYRIQPRKEQGQNFLMDDEVIQKMIEAANITKTDTVLEIGPGFGMLTSALIQHAGKTIAIEQDRILFKAMQSIVAISENFEIYNDDIRTFHLEKAGLHDKQYKLVANVPYSITSWILRQFTETAPRPSSLTVMIQKEVAERIIAPAGKMSILSNAIQSVAEAEIVTIVPNTAFYPEPKVDSAVIHITLLNQSKTTDHKQYMRFVKIGFSNKRKKLKNNLQTGLQISSEQAEELLQKVHLSKTIRAQELSIQEWETLRTCAQNGYNFSASTI